VDLRVQWYPETDPCTGRVGVSPLTWDGVGRTPGSNPARTGPSRARARMDVSDLIPPYAERVRIALGAPCQPVPGYCPSDMVVWIDDVRFGVYDASATGVPDGDPETRPVVLGLAHRISRSRTGEASPSLPTTTFPGARTQRVAGRSASGRVW